MTNASASLEELSASLTSLQHSARRTVPMFLVGVLATIIAAGAALYYIVTLSAEVRRSHQALAESQAALGAATKELNDIKATLSKQATTTSSPADASALRTAIASISATQANVTSASTAVKQATAGLDATDPSAHQAPARLTAAHDSVTPENLPELTGEFVTIPTVDHFLALRDQPSLRGALIAKVPSNSVMKCAQAIPNENGNYWRPCTDPQGNSGYVANKFLRQAK